MWPTFLSLCLALSPRSRRQARPRRRPAFRRPRLEALEDRTLPSTFTAFPVPTASSFPAGIILGADGNLWSTEEGANQIARITPAGSVTEFPVPAASSRPWGNAAGPDGNVWFGVEGDGVPGAVGRITPAGAITLFPVLAALSYPDIVTGPDGNLWVTEATSHQIAVVSPQGVLLNQYSIPVAGAVPEFIISGPNGEVWFTAIVGPSGPSGPVGTAYVGSVSTAGSFTMFQLPATSDNVKGITAGPDGNLWIVEQDANKIGRLTPSGVLTEFAIPTPNSNPDEIRPGPDGNLWFAENTTNQIASISPSGVIMEYPVPTPNSGPLGIVTGPDNNLWFAEGTASQIGRFTPGQQGPFVVTTTADSGPGSLREAINDINADPTHAVWASPGNPSVDEIDFAITAASDTGGRFNATTGVATITPQTNLPFINNAVLINGYTQAGASPNTHAMTDPDPRDNAVLKIVLDGSQAPPPPSVAPAPYGLFINADNCTVRGLVIDNVVNGDGILLWAGAHSLIAGNFIGTDASGTIALGNDVGAMADSHGSIVIGGTTPEDRNIISGNQWGVWDYGGINAIQGNYIGTNASGKVAVGNTEAGMYLRAGGEQVGGTAPGAGNLISGNSVGGQAAGIRVTADNVVIQGNLIGTDVTGTQRLVNDVGILFESGSNNMIGGTASGARNVISGNPVEILLTNGSGNVVAGNYIGTDITGTSVIPDTAFTNTGVAVRNAASNDTIGGTTSAAGNLIAGFGSGVGVGLFGASGSIPVGNSILGNSIYDNGTGITLDTGANDNQAAPVLTAAYAPSGATIALGTITSTPSTTFHLEFFANAAGDPEGRTLLGSQSVTTDASGHGSFTAFLPALPAGQGLVTATATDPSGNTSEFSAGVTATPLPPSSLSGVVWEDFNNDGQVDFGENGISGVTITLTGTDFLGRAVNPPSQLTDGDGAYIFGNLFPGNYTLTETPPAGYGQGIDSVGTAGGSVSATDQFSVALGIGVNGLNYNFGELPPPGAGVHHGQTAGIGFWNNKNGQALIKSLNGGAGTQLADWLAATLPNTFGKNAGGNDVAGQGNAAIAALFQQDFVMKGVKLDGQLLATALSVYVTSATLDPTKVAASYGFTVSGDGAGTATASVGGNGDAFGVANNTTMTLMDLLLAADAQAVNGVLYNGNATRRSEANNVFSAVNDAG
jgi:streptogramin lyase